MTSRFLRLSAWTLPDPSAFRGPSSFRSLEDPAAWNRNTSPRSSTENLSTIVSPQVCELPPSSMLMTCHLVGGALSDSASAGNATAAIAANIHVARICNLPFDAVKHPWKLACDRPVGQAWPLVFA